MAFVEGVANSYADLLTAIETAMLANGWTKSGTVLHADGCFVKLAVVGNTVTLLGGAGITGGSVLQTPGPSVVRIGAEGTVMAMQFPVTYRISLQDSPREVYLHVNYNVNDWQWLAFGVAAVETPGSGVWYGGSFSAVNQAGIHINVSGGSTGGAGFGAPGLFWGAGNASGAGGNSFIHVDIDGVAWASAPGGTAPDGSLNMAGLAIGLSDRSPSSFNGASVLIPCSVWLRRAGNTISLVAELAHSRVLRVDNYVPGQLVSSGADRWMAFPLFRKNAAARDGATINGPAAHTGTMGMAVRYDGP